MGNDKKNSANKKDPQALKCGKLVVRVIDIIRSKNQRLNPEKCHDSGDKKGKSLGVKRKHSDDEPVTTIKKVNSIAAYNSEDEVVDSDISTAEWSRRDKAFAELMRQQGLVLVNVGSDGACLFRSVSLQIFGDEDLHFIIRKRAMDYIYENRENFQPFITEDILSYIARKRDNHAHGNHIEIQAISELYNRPIEIYSYQPRPTHVINWEYSRPDNPPIRLAYQQRCHYNAILTAGIGEGLRAAGQSPVSKGGKGKEKEN